MATPAGTTPSTHSSLLLGLSAPDESPPESEVTPKLPIVAAEDGVFFSMMPPKLRP